MLTKRKTWYFLSIFLGIGLVFLLSWIQDPTLGLPSFLPASLRAWTNRQENENIRTAVPFVFLGLVFSLHEFRRAFSFPRYTIALLLLALVVTLAEAGQAFIPHRSPDPGDIAWGIAGSLLGMIIPLPFRWLSNTRKY